MRPVLLKRFAADREARVRITLRSLEIPTTVIDMHHRLLLARSRRWYSDEHKQSDTHQYEACEEGYTYEYQIPFDDTLKHG